MTPEQRAALSRVRRVEAGEGFDAVYGVCLNAYGQQQFYTADRLSLADAFLAEHPADESELATYEWAREQSPHIGRTDGQPVLYLGALNGVGIRIKTRGQLRRLLKELKHE